jgi:fatty-acyl-CoA synthase
VGKSTERADIFERDLDRNAANSVSLSPLSFLRRAADVYPDKVAVIHGDRRHTYREFYERCCRLASALAGRGVGVGDTVAVIAPNVPELLEAHYGVPMLGAVLNAINTRLDSEAVAFVLRHGEAKVVITDKELSGMVAGALDMVENRPLVIDIDDPMAGGGDLLGETDYEAFLRTGDPDFSWQLPEDEWQAIALNYTSGTAGNPKGVVYSHRGAYLNALGNALAFGVGLHSVYLWTLPMFHCSGWSYPWAMSAVAGTHVCLRKVDPAVIYPLIAEHKVTHLCAAPGLDYYLSIHSLDISRRSIPPGIQSDAAATTTTTTTIANPSGVLVRGWQRATSARSLGRAVYLGMCCLPTSAKLFSLTLPAYITIAMAPPPNPHQS